MEVIPDTRLDPCIEPKKGGGMFGHWAVRRRLLVALIVGGAAFGISSAVQASIPDSNAIVHSCYNMQLAHGSPIGAMRAIDTDKAGGVCAPWEGAVDLATPQYVQNVVASTVNQTAGMFSAPVFYNVNADWRTIWTCPDGYIGIDPWVQANEAFGINHYLTVKSEANYGSLAGGAPGPGVNIYYNISTGTPSTYVNGVTCVDGRVYGQPGPALPPNAGAKPHATLTVVPSP